VKLTNHRVHPCACRADRDISNERSLMGGSSLRVQGGLSRRPSLLGIAGFIPARAGRTQRPARHLGDDRVHPCACRADARGVDHANGRRGSSLRVQGKTMGPELDAILVDAQQCLGLVPGDVSTARIFVQGLVGVWPHPEPREVFLRVQHLNLQIESVR
jgi:hypothetical protein